MSMQSDTREQMLLNRLKYLETPLCRAIMSDEQRKKEIKEATDDFRNFLRVKESVKLYGGRLHPGVLQVFMDHHLYG